MAGKRRSGVPTPHQERHALAQLKYAKTAKGKAAIKRYASSAKGKATINRYERSQNGKKRRLDWRTGPGKATTLASNARYYYQNIPKFRAANRTPERIATKKRWIRATRMGLPGSAAQIREWLDKGLLDPALVAWLTRD